MVLPTAWGKSWLTAYVARAIGGDDRLLVLQPTKELLEQNYEKYISLCGDLAEAGIFSASFKKRDIRKITYATIGSIKRLGSEFRELGFTKMLVDEAHMYPRAEESMIGQFLADSGIKHVLGITATPLKMETISSVKLVDKKDKDGKPVKKNGQTVKKKVFDGYSKLVMLTNPSNDGTFFRTIIHISQISEMTSLGFWSRLRYDAQPYDPSSLKFSSDGSDFTERSKASAYESNGVHKNILSALRHYADRKHCLVFTPSVEEAQLLSQECPLSAYVCAKTPRKEREKVISDFRSGALRVVFNAQILSTGFDYPEIDCIILGAPTASVARFYQMCGRGVRIAPGKADCLIVDMCGNLSRFGRIEDIFFENEVIWRMYGTGYTLLSGIPIECIGCYSHSDVHRMVSMQNRPVSFSFGKYKGWNLQDVPLGYLRWFLKSKCMEQGDYFDVSFLDQVRKALENDIRDTRNEPPMVIMPHGIHQQELLSQIPRGYLIWLYNNTKWTPMNDSLRRGVEIALQVDTLF